MLSLENSYLNINLISSSSLIENIMPLKYDLGDFSKFKTSELFSFKSKTLLYPLTITGVNFLSFMVFFKELWDIKEP